MNTLIIAGCSPATVKLDKEGWSPAHLAAFRGHTAILDRLLLGGFDIDAPSGVVLPPDLGGLTVLHVAAGAGEVGFVRRCVSHNASLTKRDLAGVTAVHYAAQGGNADALKALAGGGADLKVREGACGDARD